MINIDCFIEALKISWIKKLLNSNDKKRIQLFEDTISKVSDLANLGDLYILKLINKTKNSFWKDTLKCWHNSYCKKSPNTPEDFLKAPLWLNSHISVYPLYVNK